MKGAIHLFLAIIVGLLSFNLASYAQCNLLTNNRNVVYTVDGQCAPTTVTQFTITYEFLSAQVPADITIRFEWNDPGNNVDVFNDGDIGFMSLLGDTQFQATSSFVYPSNNNCAFYPTAYLYYQGALCASSAEQKVAISWSTDNNFGGILDINPNPYEVCYGDAIVGAQFADNSTFNCNIIAEPTNPNQIERNVQFVYGNVATHNPAATILNLSLEDGGTQSLTDGTGALVATSTRGTAGLMITAAYFGPVTTVPFPANAPSATSFLMNAPADVANAVGNTFEVTMFNWNICNPYNGDAANPNYDEAISTTSTITIVAAPAPGFQTRKDNAAGILTTDFCIGDDIYFENLTVGGGLNYYWEFFDDAIGTPPAIATGTATNPTYAYSGSGQKLIRLSATNPTAQAGCTRSFDVLVNITPTVIADIRTTDLSDVIITPDFCQDNTTPTSFDVRFYDDAIGTPTANSEWRWEFYDEFGALFREEPGPGVFSTTVLGPFDQTYANPGIYLVRYITRDGSTLCEITDEVYIRVYNDPVSDFSATRVCEGDDTDFQDLSTLSPINGEAIVTWEWDFNYDGFTFNKDAAYDNQTVFTRNMGAAATYDVALRTVTDQNACEHIKVIPVIVDPLPLSTYTVDQIEGCSILPVEITNTGHASQPANVLTYTWQLDPEQDGSFVDELVQDPGLIGFSTVFTLDFENTTQVDQFIDLRLITENEFNCTSTGPTITITVHPAPQTSYTATNYNVFANNCGSVSVDFLVDAVTQSLNPTQYTWHIEDENGSVTADVVLPPATTIFNYVFTNSSPSLIKDYEVTLTADFPGGCSSDVTQTIRVNPIPEGTFAIDTLLFDCQTMRLEMEADQKGLNEYYWEIEVNGGAVVASSALGDMFQHDFNRPLSTDPADNVVAYLTTTNFANCQSTREQIAIDVPPQDDIGVNFDVSPTVQTLPNSVVTITNNTNVGNWQYLWDFGDGNTSTDPLLTGYDYGIYGVFTITLTATSQSCEEVFSRTVTINPIPPIVDFDFEPDDGCAPLEVRFTNLSQYAEQDTYIWDFGEGNATSMAVNPTYTYTQPGTYTVSLSASNITGLVMQEIKEQVIRVYGNPSAFFEVRPNQVYLPNPIYTNNSSFGASGFLWNFGDGTTSNEFEPQHIYTEEGLYNISLVATNENGCSDTLVVDNAVVAKERGGIRVANAFSPSLSGPADENVGQGNSGATGNDVFLPLMENVSEFQMQIFNRWGELLFESNDPNVGWNGYYKGKLVPQDVYAFKISAVFNNGEQETMIGDATLIR